MSSIILVEIRNYMIDSDNEVLLRADLSTEGGDLPYYVTLPGQAEINHIWLSERDLNVFIRALQQLKRVRRQSIG